MKINDKMRLDFLQKEKGAVVKQQSSLKRFGTVVALMLAIFGALTVLGFVWPECGDKHYELIQKFGYVNKEYGEIVDRAEVLSIHSEIEKYEFKYVQMLLTHKCNASWGHTGKHSEFITESVARSEWE